jgi:hypothetical protein
MVPNEGKRIVVHKKNLRNDYVNGPRVHFIMFATGITTKSITLLWKGLATFNQFANKQTNEI